MKIKFIDGDKIISSTENNYPSEFLKLVKEVTRISLTNNEIPYIYSFSEIKPAEDHISLDYLDIYVQREYEDEDEDEDGE